MTTLPRIDEETLQLLKEAALLYIDQTSQLDLIKQQCEECVNNKEVSECSSTEQKFRFIEKLGEDLIKTTKKLK